MAEKPEKFPRLTVADFEKIIAGQGMKLTAEQRETFLAYEAEVNEKERLAREPPNRGVK